jgi:hypothetical protein
LRRLERYRVIGKPPCSRWFDAFPEVVAIADFPADEPQDGLGRVVNQLGQDLDFCPSYRPPGPRCARPEDELRPLSMAEIDPDLRRDDEEESAAPSRILTVIFSTLPLLRPASIDDTP